MEAFCGRGGPCKTIKRVKTRGCLVSRKASRVLNYPNFLVQLCSRYCFSEIW